MVEYLFNLFELLVENIFGGVALAIFGMLGVLWIIMLVCKVGGLFGWVWTALYLITMFTFYGGSLALIFGIIGSTILLISAIIKWSNIEQ